MDFLIHHMLRTSAQRLPNKEAMVHGKERLTYAEVARRTAGLARGLREAGVQRGDRVGIYLEASVPQVISIFGISESGGSYVPINAQLFAEQVAHIAKDCGMKGLITTASKIAALEGTLKDIPSLEFLIVVDEGTAPVVKLPGAQFRSPLRPGSRRKIQRTLHLQRISPPSFTLPVPPASPKASCSATPT